MNYISSGKQCNDWLILYVSMTRSRGIRMQQCLGSRHARWTDSPKPFTFQSCKDSHQNYFGRGASLLDLGWNHRTCVLPVSDVLAVQHRTSDWCERRQNVHVTVTASTCELSCLPKNSCQSWNILSLREAFQCFSLLSLVMWKCLSAIKQRSH